MTMTQRRPMRRSEPAPKKRSLHKIGNRVLRSGDIIQIKGERGLWKVLDFGAMDGCPVLTAVGGPCRNVRTFNIFRAGTRKALTGSKKAAELWRS